MFTCPACKETWSLDQADINYHFGILDREHITLDAVYGKHGAPALYTANDIARGELGVELVREDIPPQYVSKLEGDDQMAVDFHDVHFCKILSELEELLKETNNAINMATKNTHYDEVIRLSEQAKTTSKVIIAVHNLENGFSLASAATGGVAAAATGCSAKVNQVTLTTKRHRLPRRGDRAITKQEAFRIPILKALVELGGSGRVNEVVDNVGRQVKAMLKSDDFGTVGSGEVRWRNAVKWCRMVLKNDGLIKADSPFGVWEISERGRKHLQAQENNDRNSNRPTVLRGD